MKEELIKIIMILSEAKTRMAIIRPEIDTNYWNSLKKIPAPGSEEGKAMGHAPAFTAYEYFKEAEKDISEVINKMQKVISTKELMNPAAPSNQ